MEAVDSLGMAGWHDRRDTAEALRAAFRAAFFCIDPGHVPGVVALHREATRIVVLRRQACRLLLAAGAANLAEVFHDDPEMLAVLADAP
jgi:hypothetical protein